MKHAVSSLLFLALSGCLGTPMTPTSATSASIADDNTLALSCSVLSERNARITTRLQQLEAESTAKQRSNVLTDTAINVGLGALMGVGASNGISGIRAASATVQGIQGVRAAERGQGAYSEITDVMALAQRSAVLQRAMVEKGCV